MCAPVDGGRIDYTVNIPQKKKLSTYAFYHFLFLILPVFFKEFWLFYHFNISIFIVQI